MSKNIRLIADSTCDLPEDVLKKYNIEVVPLCIVLNDVSYYDGIELTTDEIYTWADENNATPKTSAISIDYFQDMIEPYMNAGDDVIFIGISEGMSSTCNVARIVGEDFDSGRLFVINSKTVSAGMGLQAIKASELIAEGKTAEEVVEGVLAYQEKVNTSFIVDTLTYLARGGRCSGAVAMIGNKLKLHPRIESVDGTLQLTKKYRGNLQKSLKAYFEDLKNVLEKAEKKKVFVVHSKMDPELVTFVMDELKKLNHFDEVIETYTGGVVTSHCGPGTLGIMFVEE